MMTALKSPKQEFIDLMTENCKVNGLDELSSRIIALLYAEPNELSLNDIAKRTGYSLSAICTAMKFIERIGFVKRLKKPKSRKVYFYMEKGMIMFSLDIIRRKYERVILPTKQELPSIIKRYKREKSENSKQELKIIENYYKEVLASEDIMRKLIKMLENAKKNLKK
ncbi:MAG: winged helix-turn-helix transcriptional regulator [Nanoarchaeota archaeon]|nr:winged helix-turn-helix transcriptional regulator [Nanoarchaeota archaeon]